MRSIPLACILLFFSLDSAVAAGTPVPAADPHEVVSPPDPAKAGQTPIAVPDAYFVWNNAALSIPAAEGLLRNDVDPDGGPLTVVSYQNAGLQGDVTLFTDGRFDYTPPAGFVGTDTFRYRMRDAENLLSQYVTVEIEVKDDPGPVGTPDAFTIFRGDTLSLDAPGLLGNDLSLDGSELAVVSYTNAGVQGDITLFIDGRMVYTPPAGFSGTETFTYRMRDGDLDMSANTTVTIDVVSTNQPPEAATDYYYVPMNGTLNIFGSNGVLVNDFDHEGDPLSATLAGGLNQGQVILNPDGGFALQPVVGFQGIDFFKYEVTDGQGAETAVCFVYVGTFGDIPTGTFTPPQASSLQLQAVHPNPFNPSTQTSFVLQADGPVSLQVYDLRGRVVASLVDSSLPAGKHTVSWDGRDSAGASVASGTYVFELRAGGERTAVKAQLVK